MKVVKNMKVNKNKNTKMSNENINGNDIPNQSQAEDRLYNPSPNTIPTRNYEPFDFEINQEFMEENKKINLNLVKHGQTHKRKFAPFTKAQRRKRRMEVYRLHFEKGMPAIRIAHLMKVDRNTINNDLRILYSKALNDYNPDMSLDDILQKQLVRLETQRDRLGLYLSGANDINSKIAIERLIADIDFKLIGVIERLGHNVVRYWDEIIKQINKIAENEKLNARYTSLFELRRISIESGESLNKLREEILKEK
jgi:hypothetical protein